MVTFPYDDIDSWNKKYTSEELIKRFETMIRKWEKGLRILNKIKTDNDFTNELIRYAKVFTINMKSTVNQYNYILKRRQYANFEKELKTEMKLIKELYLLTARDSKIGFEASNQYVFTQNAFLEKIINLKNISKQNLN